MIALISSVGCGDSSDDTTPSATPDAGADISSDATGDTGADATQDAGNNGEADLPPANEVPIAVAGEDQMVAAGAVVNLDGSASYDPEGESLQYIWTQEQGHPVRFDPASETPSFATPDFTTHIIMALVVSDGDNLSVPDRVDILVQGPNRAPTADAGSPRTGILADAVSLDGNRSMDPDGDDITFLWTQTDGPAVQLSDPQSPEPRFRTDFEGPATLTFSLVVSDGELESRPSEVQVEVRNHRPVAHAGRDGVVLLESEYTLDGSGSSDQDDDEITYRWSQVDGLPVNLTPPGSPTPSFVAPDLAGPVVFQLVVHDGEIESLGNRVTVLAVGPDYTDSDRDQLRDESEAEFSTDVDDPDTDNDGIPDGWEELGHEGVDFHGIGCSALHRDLLVEIDHQGARLDETLVEELKAQFAALPIENPDGVPGIALHIVYDAQLAPNFYCFYPGEGDAGDRSLLKRAHRDTFHKIQICIGDTVRLVHRSPRDIVLEAPEEPDEAQRQEIIAAITRGLGFDLGLDVGGVDGVDAKPNYPSVMNSAYNLTGFSTGALPALDECALVETAPFGDVPAENLAFLATYPGGGWTPGPQGDIDWNRNDEIDTEPYSLVLRPDAQECALLEDHDDASVLGDALAPSLDVVELQP